MKCIGKRSQTQFWKKTKISFVSPGAHGQIHTRTRAKTIKNQSTTVQPLDLGRIKRPIRLPDTRAAAIHRIAQSSKVTRSFKKQERENAKRQKKKTKCPLGLQAPIQVVLPFSVCFFFFLKSSKSLTKCINDNVRVIQAWEDNRRDAERKVNSKGLEAAILEEKAADKQLCLVKKKNTLMVINGRMEPVI